MRIVSRTTLENHARRHARARDDLHVWYLEAKAADWKSPNDIRKRYPSASFVGKQRVVFNICGNRYRLIVAIHYKTGIVFVRFFGSHAEYDAVDAETI